MLAILALTGCRFAEHSRRVASDAFASFVLESLVRFQTPLTQGTVQRSPLLPAPSHVCATAPAATTVTVTATALPQPAIIEAETLPIVRTAISKETLIASELPAACVRAKAKRIIVRTLREGEIAHVNLELSFARAEMASLRTQRFVFVTSNAS
jgi:hypothetical protein